MNNIAEVLQSTDTPLWITLISPLIVISGVVYTIRRTDRREIESWRREKILQFASELIEHSNKRMEMLTENQDALIQRRRSAQAVLDNQTHTESMRIATEKLQLLCNRPMSIAANDLIFFHQTFYASFEYIQDEEVRSHRLSEFNAGIYWRQSRFNSQLEKNLGLKRPWYVRMRRFAYRTMSYKQRERSTKILTWYRQRTNSFYRHRAEEEQYGMN